MSIEYASPSKAKRTSLLVYILAATSGLWCYFPCEIVAAKASVPEDVLIPFAWLGEHFSFFSHFLRCDNIADAIRLVFLQSLCFSAIATSFIAMRHAWQLSNPKTPLTLTLSPEYEGEGTEHKRHF